MHISAESPYHTQRLPRRVLESTYTIALYCCLKVNKNFAINLVAEEPVSDIEVRVVSCDGGGGALGHPKVYINLVRPCRHHQIKLFQVLGIHIAGIGMNLLNLAALCSEGSQKTQRCCCTDEAGSMMVSTIASQQEAPSSESSFLCRVCLMPLCRLSPSDS